MNTEQFKELYARYQDRLQCKINWVCTVEKDIKSV